MSAPWPTRKQRREIARFGIFDQEQYLLKRRRGPRNDVEGRLWAVKLWACFVALVLLALGLLAGMVWVVVAVALRVFS